MNLFKKLDKNQFYQRYTEIKNYHVNLHMNRYNQKI